MEYHFSLEEILKTIEAQESLTDVEEEWSEEDLEILCKYGLIK